jgi:RNA recognition motif-containing protein
MATKLYVGNLSYNTTNEGLKDLFAAHGEVVSAEIIFDKFSGNSKGFGFVEMSTPEAAETAISNLNDKEVDGRNITVSIAREKTASSPRRPYSGNSYSDRDGNSSFRRR